MGSHAFSQAASTAGFCMDWFPSMIDRSDEFHHIASHEDYLSVQVALWIRGG